jgi:hypothetical protein
MGKTSITTVITNSPDEEVFRPNRRKIFHPALITNDPDPQQIIDV